MNEPVTITSSIRSSSAAKDADENNIAAKEADVPNNRNAFCNSIFPSRELLYLS
jgi:hypothetical protein